MTLLSIYGTVTNQQNGHLQEDQDGARPTNHGGTSDNWMCRMWWMHNTSNTSIYQNTSTTSIYQDTSNTSQHLGGRKDIYINHNIPYVSSHSFSSLAINLRLQLQPHRTVVRGLHASLTNRLLWLYSWLPTITVTLKSRTPFRLYLSLRYRFVTSGRWSRGFHPA